MTSIKFAVYANTPKNIGRKTALTIFVQFSFSPFSSTKPSLARARCMDQSKAFCPRNFDKTVSKIQQMRSKTSCRFLFFSVGTCDDGHEGKTLVGRATDNRKTVGHTHAFLCTLCVFSFCFLPVLVHFLLFWGLCFTIFIRFELGFCPHSNNYTVLHI